MKKIIFSSLILFAIAAPLSDAIAQNKKPKAQKALAQSNKQNAGSIEDKLKKSPKYQFANKEHSNTVTFNADGTYHSLYKDFELNLEFENTGTWELDKKRSLIICTPDEEEGQYGYKFNGNNLNKISDGMMVEKDINGKPMVFKPVK